MPRTCSICTHPQRAEIEAALIAGSSNREIFALFRVSKDAQWRHKENCIPESVKQSQAAKEELQGLEVVKQLKAINGVTLTILQEARDEKQNVVALQAIDRVMKQLELQAKLLGDIDDRPQIELVMHPEWVSLREILFQALSPWPDARIAVARAIVADGGQNVDSA